MQSWRVPHRRRQERRRFCDLVALRESAGLRSSGDERAQAAGAGATRAGLPRLDRVDVHVQARRELTLGQPDPPSQLQEQPTKTVARAAI